MKRRSYPSDLSEQEWVLLEPLIPPAKPGGHPRTTDMREVINVILYLDRTVANGEPYRMSFHPGPRCGAISAPGVTMGPGSGCIRRCAKPCA